ncbi:PAS domain S-box-containing protein [Pseudomonas asplenii]|uniref:PAS domain S-box-containing protein n=1 Tax=Pseudomonas asplenii TaxID=53407 RepID=A0A1H1YCU1_9PSED|nr:helix-turn-helix transcriptional regulator [Pseudomonas asplenii]SDT19204.1 PAS domain S-box-containing protein [Pseudomonas asplenii]
MSQDFLATETNRRQLQQIISGLSDGVILIEIDQSILWANEAALAMHGVSEVGELGANAAQYRKRFALRYRNHHALTADSYPIARVAKGETFSDLIVEVTPQAEPERTWVHNIRSMILTDRAGEPESLVLIISDATELAVAEQRFEKAFGANPAPAVICRLSDLRYIKVNQGFLEMTGYRREEVIGRSVYELDVLEEAERRELAIQRLGEGATIPQMQAELKLAHGGSKLVIVAGQPLDINEQDCMLFTFMDLEPRRRIETALRQSEERFAKAFRLAPAPTLLCVAADRQLLDINEAFLDSTGYSAQELLGQRVEAIGVFEDDKLCERIFSVLATNGRLSNLDLRIRRKDGELIDCALSADSVQIQGEPCYLLVLMNITERKRSEMELVAAIEAAMQDTSWFSQKLIEKLATVKNVSVQKLPGLSYADLTPRERDVLELICEGLADKEIAARLKLAPNTVRNHVATVYSKLAVHSRSEAIVWARERGLFSGRSKD